MLVELQLLVYYSRKIALIEQTQGFVRRFVYPIYT